MYLHLNTTAVTTSSLVLHLIVTTILLGIMPSGQHECVIGQFSYSFGDAITATGLPIDRALMGDLCYRAGRVQLRKASNWISVWSRSPILTLRFLANAHLLWSKLGCLDQKLLSGGMYNRGFRSLIGYVMLLMPRTLTHCWWPWLRIISDRFIAEQVECRDEEPFLSKVPLSITRTSLAWKWD